MSEWISVRDRLPEERGFYILHSPDCTKELVFVDWWDGKHFTVADGDWAGDTIYGVTHWMPLPSPPVKTT